MNKEPQIANDGLCTVGRYRTAWEVGTGLPVGLKPGTFRIIGYRESSKPALQLDDQYCASPDVCDEDRIQRQNAHKIQSNYNS